MRDKRQLEEQPADLEDRRRDPQRVLEAGERITRREGRMGMTTTSRDLIPKYFFSENE